MKIELFWQLYASIIVSLPVLHFSWICGWSTIDLHTHRILSESSANESSLSMIAFLSSGGIIGSLLQLYLIDKIGRKNSVLFLTIPFTIASWLLILANDINCLYVAWSIIGSAAGAACVSIPIFIAEISSKNIRGRVNTILSLAYFTGNAIGILVTNYVNEKESVTYSFVIPTLFALGFCFLPETSVYLKQIGRFEEADHSLRFYNGLNSTPEFEKFMPSVTNRCSTNREAHFGTPAVRRILVISTIMTALPSVCGTIVLLNYTIESSSQTISSSLPINPTLFLAIVALIANLLTIFLIDSIGRKILLIGSLVGTAIGFFMFSLRELTKDRYPNTEWIQFPLLSITIFMACIGILPVSHVFKMDILPPKIRNLSVSILHMFFWIFSSCTLKVCPYLVPYIHEYFMAAGATCLLCTLFVYVYVPETKGKSHRCIERQLRK